MAEEERQKRKLKRRHLIYYLRVFDQKTGELVGHLADITIKGIMLMSEKELPINKTYSLKVLINPGEEEPEYLEFDAVAKWSRPDVNPTFWDTGFELVNATAADFRRISDLIEELGFEE